MICILASPFPGMSGHRPIDPRGLASACACTSVPPLVLVLVNSSLLYCVVFCSWQTRLFVAQFGSLNGPRRSHNLVQTAAAQRQQASMYSTCATPLLGNEHVYTRNTFNTLSYLLTDRTSAHRSRQIGRALEDRSN